MLNEAKCRTCGRLFIPAPQNVLKDNRGVYCKPTCYLHRNDKKTEGKGRAARMVEQYTKDGELIKTFESAKRAAIDLGLFYPALARAIRQNDVYHGFRWKYKERSVDNGGTQNVHEKDC